MSNIFTIHQLDKNHKFLSASLPAEELQKLDFDEIWNLHPEEFHEVFMGGRWTKLPRWQQAYGKDYAYTGTVNKALPIPTQIQNLHTWIKENVDSRLNGLLLNWYDGDQKHYIGRHRDSTENMIEGAPIVTLSLGGERIFRLRPIDRKEKIDFIATNGTIFSMPYETNSAYKHEVPNFARYKDRRISVTFRAFH